VVSEAGTDTAASGPAPGTPDSVSEQWRKQHFDHVLRSLVGMGGRIVGQSEYQAFLAFGGNGLSPLVHALHGVLTFSTIGLWSIVWVLHYARARGWRRVVAIDVAGRLTGHAWKPSADGLSPPQIGSLMSREGIVVAEPGKRSASVAPDIPLTRLTKIVAYVRNQPESGVALRYVYVRTKYGWFDAVLTDRAQAPALIYWFALG
jgi:hypothetical protein